ncbi:coniferyl aldehyde dehydrogenase [Marinospirillum sp.]|uniref:coniferyl aldehyde dehydrogenase n=1 Tax=Marinospirillum sp. TaxID=2183934 RepID=UPI003A89C426
MHHPASLAQSLHQLRTAYQAQTYPDLATRRDRLQRLEHALKRHAQPLISALNTDFGQRARHESLLADLLPLLSEIRFVQRRLKGWMRAQKRQVHWMHQPATARVIYQPLGVVGVMVPWNYPVQLAISPLISILAAGNRAFLKLSEWTPATNQALITCLREAFSADEVAIALGEAEISAAFAALPFDHLMFTGSSAVGKKIQRAAAEHLVPVTLELGGKSPALLDQDIPLPRALDPLLFGKTFNAGQTCIAPDYLLCPEARLEEVLTYLKARFTALYPQLLENPHYTALINSAQQQRLSQLAATSGAERILELNPAQEDFSHSQKLPLTLLVNPAVDSRVMTEEIFGPLLPILTYTHWEEALDQIRQRPRPLTLYYFGHDQQHQRQLEYQVHSGSLAINATLVQVAQPDLPFGGIGASGMGCYHGREGFMAFSHPRAVFQRRGWDVTRLLDSQYRRRWLPWLESWFLR